MPPRKKRSPSPTSAEAIATETSSDDSRNTKQAKTPASSVSSSSSSFHKGKRGRPKKLVIATRSNGDLKNFAGAPALAIDESPSGTSDSTSTTTKKVGNPEIPNSKNEKLEIDVAGDVSLKETADPEQNSFPAAGYSSNANQYPPSPNLIRKKSPRKGKPSRAPFY